MRCAGCAVDVRAAVPAARHAVRRRVRAERLRRAAARKLCTTAQAELVVVLVLLAALRTGDHLGGTPSGATSRLRQSARRRALSLVQRGIYPCSVRGVKELGAQRTPPASVFRANFDDRLASPASASFRSSPSDACSTFAPRLATAFSASLSSVTHVRERAQEPAPRVAAPALRSPGAPSSEPTLASLSLSSRTNRSAVFFPMPGTLASRARSPARTARARSPTESALRARRSPSSVRRSECRAADETRAARSRSRNRRGRARPRARGCGRRARPRRQSYARDRAARGYEDS